MDKSIISSGKKIYDSGTFLTLNENPHIISFKRGNEKVSFELQFIDETKEHPKFKVDSKGTRNDLTIVLYLYNFIHPLGVGFPEPLSLAKFENGDEIFFNLLVYGGNNNLNRKLVCYTIYGEETSHG